MTAGEAGQWQAEFELARRRAGGWAPWLADRQVIVWEGIVVEDGFRADHAAFDIPTGWLPMGTAAHITDFADLELRAASCSTLDTASDLALVYAEELIVASVLTDRARAAVVWAEQRVLIALTVAVAATVALAVYGALDGVFARTAESVADGVVTVLGADCRIFERAAEPVAANRVAIQRTGLTGLPILLRALQVAADRSAVRGTAELVFALRHTDVVAAGAAGARRRLEDRPHQPFATFRVLVAEATGLLKPTRYLRRAGDDIGRQDHSIDHHILIQPIDPGNVAANLRTKTAL